MPDTFTPSTKKPSTKKLYSTKKPEALEVAQSVEYLLRSYLLLFAKLKCVFSMSTAVGEPNHYFAVLLSIRYGGTQVSWCSVFALSAHSYIPVGTSPFMPCLKRNSYF